jgi:hypothetical protein
VDDQLRRKNVRLVGPSGNSPYTVSSLDLVKDRILAIQVISCSVVQVLNVVVVAPVEQQ